MPLPDLLSPEPALRLDRKLVAQGVAFAYAAGEGGAILENALREAKVGPSSFEPSHFAADLFVDELVRTCFIVTIDGRTFTPNRAHLASLLVRPPKDAAACSFRRSILRELVDTPALRAELEKTYVELHELRQLLGANAAVTVPEQHQHRVAIMRALKNVIVGLSTRFAASNSGLARLRHYGQELRSKQGYAALDDLLRYEDGLSQVDVSVRVGADGSVRSFALASIKEATESRFHQGPARRFWTRIVLFFRGYRFGEFELLARLLDSVFAPFEDEIVNLFQAMNDIEVYLGALGFHDFALARGLSVCLPELLPAPREGSASPRRIHGLFNPLLFADRGVPKPCDIESKRHDAIVIVTGPNSGGKTRLLQALAVTQLLAQNGLFVPAASAKLAWTQGLFVSLSHELSAGQREGRLGTELLRIRALFDELGPGDIVLFDELCSGTNPSEAEAIIRLVLELLSELNPQVFMTTHFLDFATELAENPVVDRLEFLRAALDEKNRPTYAFSEGVAKSALAAETAARLGVTLEELAAIVARRKTERRPAAALPDELSHGELFSPVAREGGRGGEIAPVRPSSTSKAAD